MNEHIGSALGYILLILPLIYWIVIDINKVRQRCSRVQLNRPMRLHYDSDNDKDSLLISEHGVGINTKMESHALTLEPIEKVLHFSNIMSWFGLMIISYIFVRCLVNYLNWRRAFKYIATDCQDIMELCIRSFLIYVLGNIVNRFEDTDTKKSFICYVIYFLVTYSVTFEGFPNIEIGGKGISNILAASLCIPFLIVFTYILLINCHVAYNRNVITRALFFGGIIVLGIIQWIMIVFASQYIRIHIHHHYYALVMAVMCRSSDKVSYVAQALLIAIFIHGITVFGCEDLFQWENVNHEYFKNKCEDWLCPAWKCILPK
eukprot:95665_1